MARVLFLTLICLGSSDLIEAYISSEFSPQSEAPKPLLEQINGTRNYRLHGKKGKDDKSWFDGREMRHIYCVRAAHCEPLKTKSCFGSVLPYTSTSLDLTDSYSQEQTMERLYSYQALRYVPKCWAVIQPFLCAVFLPKCENVTGKAMVYLPSLEMCRKTFEPCRLLYNTSYFPEFLKCNETLFPSKCNNDVREMKFNATGQCLKPLVQAESAASYYKDIEGCGLQCQNPLYTDDEHRQIHKLIGWCATVCIVLNVFTIATFIIDWHSASKYPALVIFYINVCFLISCVGWLSQFWPGAREDIVCRRDGTLRFAEPSGGGNLSCYIVFIFVYYFLIAAMVWFVIFTYAWYMSSQAIGKIPHRIDKRGSYFHLVAWSCPFVLTIIPMAISEVDGNYITGICFVGYVNHPIRAVFLIGPIIISLLVGGFLISRGMLTLINLKITSKEVMSTRDSKKIRHTIVRTGICSFLILVFSLTSIVCHAYEFRWTSAWTDALREYIICQISSTFTDVQQSCKMAARPSVAVLQLHLLCLFVTGIVMSSWCWTHPTREAWVRFFRRRCGKERDDPVRVPKHKVIRQTFARRKELQNQGRLSISFHNSHTDPLGFNFDLNSVKGSYDFSTTWANNLTKFVTRRGALTGPATSSSQNRKNSVDSEISFSVRHVSVESRRNSVDSQVSVKIAEMKTKVASRSSRGPKSHKSRHRRRDFSSNRRFSRKESTTSMESAVIAVQRRRSSSAGGIFDAHSKRRPAIDRTQINELFSNGKFILPFLAPGLTTSDDDDGSHNSMRVQNSQIDLMVHKLNAERGATDDEKMSMRRSAEADMKRSGGGRASRNSLKRAKKTTRGGASAARRSRKSSSRREKRDKAEKAAAMTAPDSFSSFGSEAPPMGTGVLSSFSTNASLTKPCSRNSKGSCDVGIQTNAHEIATQTMSSFEFNEKNLKDEENHDIYSESHPFLGGLVGGGCGRRREPGIALRKREGDVTMSQSEKLRHLLLPEK